MSAAPPSPFRKADGVESYLKVFVYGSWGSGKTWFALSAPKPIAVVDTEGGTAMYEGIFDFAVLRSSGYKDVVAAIDWVERNPGSIKTLVIDPITVIYETLQDAALKARVVKAQRKAAKAGSAALADFDAESVDLEMLDWGRIKRLHKSLLNRLANLRCHVIVTARERDDLEFDPKSGQSVRRGVRPDTERGTAYTFDVVLRASTHGEDRVFVVEKARGRVGEFLALGSKHVNPTFDGLFGPFLGAKHGKAKATPVPRAVDGEGSAARDAEVFGETLPTPEQLTELFELLVGAGYDPDELRVARRWPPYTEMSSDQVNQLIAWARARQKGREPDAEA